MQISRDLYTLQISRKVDFKQKSFQKAKLSFINKTNSKSKAFFQPQNISLLKPSSNLFLEGLYGISFRFLRFKLKVDNSLKRESCQGSNSRLFILNRRLLDPTVDCWVPTVDCCRQCVGLCFGLSLNGQIISQTAINFF